MGLVALALMLATYSMLSQAVDKIAINESVTRSQAWADSLLTQVPDIKEIIGGQVPTDDSVLFMEQARTIGDVWQFKIYNNVGKLVVVSSQLGRTGLFNETLDSMGFDVRGAIRRDGIAIRSRPRAYAHEPLQMTETVIPFVKNGMLIGYLALEVDDTRRSAENRNVISRLGMLLLTLMFVAFGAPSLAFMRRTHQKEKAEGQLEYLAYHDGLTGLKNRNAISRVLDQALLESRDNHLAVHMLDLDNFKTVNDTLGHEAGDTLLKAVAERLTKACGADASIGRLGGDEFMVVQTGLKRAGQAEQLAGTILAALKKPVSSNGTEIECGGSLGTAIYPSDGRASSDLLRSADTALYVAKSAGRGCYRLFRPEYDTKMQRRSLVEAKIRHALATNGFSLAFQPIFNLATKRIESVEALLRLYDNEVGNISPAEFIPIAEEAGLIEDVGDWVIGEACRSLALLPTQMKLALNLSTVQFGRGDLVGTVMKAVASSKIDPRRLELEITESLLLKDSSEVQEKIKRLKALGCSLALDDFGSGYSSLSYLWRYPFNKIKIDREFIAAISSNPDVQGIVEIIMHLAKKLKMQVTAEGVETYDQEVILAEIGCDQVQGFLYSKPVPMADLAPFFLRDFYSKEMAPKLRAPEEKQRSVAS
jgi:diguanylate cyclase (GGDEF)-like protein